MKTLLIILSAFLLSTVAHANGLKVAKGTVLITAPTALNGPSNQGIWFVSNGMFSLELPPLPMNQVYEGWIVEGCTGKKISTGLFRATGGIDSDAAGPFAGPLSLNFPPVPGSDFVTLGSNIANGDHSVVVTVEPYPDDDANPSGVGVLSAAIPMGATVGTILTMTNIAN